MIDPPMNKKIQSLPDQHRIMTIATLRPDGWTARFLQGLMVGGDGLWAAVMCPACLRGVNR